MDELDYLRRRERQERAAAKRAFSTRARAAHQEMALLYSWLIARLAAGEATRSHRAPHLFAG